MNAHPATDDAVYHPLIASDFAIIQDDRVFHLGLDHLDIISHRRVRADVAVTYKTIVSDDQRPAQKSLANELGANTDSHLPLNDDLLIQRVGAIYRRDFAKQELIALEQIIRLTGILPPTRDLPISDLKPMIDQILMSIAYFILTAGTGPQRLHRIKNMMIINVYSRNGKVALWHFGLFLD